MLPACPVATDPLAGGRTGHEARGTAEGARMGAWEGKSICLGEGVVVAAGPGPSGAGRRRVLR